MRRISALALLSGAVVIAGCGSSSSSSSAAGGSGAPGGGAATRSGAQAPPTKPGAGGVNPNAKETLPPGDIPDTVAYVPYVVPHAGFSVSVPEGWSRTDGANTVSFTDKLNTIRAELTTAHGPVTVALVRSSAVPMLAASVKGYQLQSVSDVSRHSGRVVRVAYLGDSQPDPVTGKVGVLAFERYYFTHGSKEVVMTLSAPNGSDNVDPWRKVTDSLKFLP